jgi:hypothetical protein
MIFSVEKILLVFILLIGGMKAALSQIRLNVILKFKTDSILPAEKYYVMTKDSVKHYYDGIDGFNLYKKHRYVLGNSESYAEEDVIGYKAIFKRYGGAKNYVLEHSRINGAMVPKYTPGRINVFEYLDLLVADKFAPRYYYLQKGEKGPIVELNKENAKTVIYDMLKDYEPSKTIMDTKGSSFKAVEEAVNAYNIRNENK